jgi:hypothetical protein
VTSRLAPQGSRPGSRTFRLAPRPALGRGATPAAAVAALAAGLALGWAVSGPGPAWAGHSGAGGYGPGAVSLAIGALAVLLAAANGFAKAYSP